MRRIIELAMMASNPQYWQKVKNTFGPSLIGYWAFDETGGTIAYDKTGLNNGTLHATLAWGGKGVGILPSTNGYMDIPMTFMDSCLGEFTISCFVNLQATSWSDGVSRYLFAFAGADASNRIIMYKLTGQGTLICNYIAGGINKSNGCPVVKITDRLHLAISVSKSNDRMMCWVNGIPTLKTAGLGTFSGTISQYAHIGNLSNGNAYWDKNIHDFCVINREITQAEALKLAAYAGSINQQYSFDGDSRTSSKSWTLGVYPGIVAAHGVVGSGNWGISGQTIATMVTNGAMNIDTKLIPGGKNVLCVWAGVNDAARSAAAIYANLVTYCNARRAAGWSKIALCTEIDAQDATRNSYNWHSTLYPALNALIYADHSCADALIDLGANAHLQDATDTTYFNADKIHPNEAGGDVIVGIAGPVLASL